MSERLIKIRADFNNADPDGRVRLNTAAAVADIAALEHPLVDGTRLSLDDGELIAHGTARFSPEEAIWTAVVDWGTIADVSQR